MKNRIKIIEARKGEQTVQSCVIALRQLRVLATVDCRPGDTTLWLRARSHGAHALPQHGEAPPVRSRKYFLLRPLLRTQLDESVAKVARALRRESACACWRGVALRLLR